MLQKSFGLLSVIVSLAGCARENGPAKPATDEKPAAITETPASKATSPDASSQVAKVKPQPAAPKPTVWHANELAKILDCSALPKMEGTKAGLKNPASLSAKIPGKIPDIAKFYLKNLADLGWQRDEASSVNYSIDEKHASVPLAKDGHVAYLSISQYGDLPDAHLHLQLQGNLDTRTLPRQEDPANFGQQTGSHYYSAKSVDDEADWLEKALETDGWQRFERFASSASAKLNLRIWTFRKHAYALNVFISSPGGDLGKKTSVQYSVKALGHELPSPPGVTKVKFEDDAWKMRCEAPGDVKTVGEFYQKAMPAIGYKPLPSVEPRDTSWNLRFETATDDIVLVEMSSKDGKNVKVNMTGISAESLAEMKRLDEINGATPKTKQPPKKAPKRTPPE